MVDYYFSYIFHIPKHFFEDVKFLFDDNTFISHSYMVSSIPM